MPTVSRSERRTRAEAAAQAMPKSAVVLTGFGIQRLSPDSSKWYAFRLKSDGTVQSLTPLRDGVQVGEGKPNATGRLKLALLQHLGGIDT